MWAAKRDAHRDDTYATENMTLSSAREYEAMSSAVGSVLPSTTVAAMATDSTRHPKICEVDMFVSVDARVDS